APLNINLEEDLEKLFFPENTTSITETNQADTTENAQESTEDFQQKLNEPDRVDLSPVMPSEQSLTFVLYNESEKTLHTDSNPIPLNKILERRKDNVMRARKLTSSNLQ
ncbi:TRAS3 protein, partial [Danaus plexippus plexippus]